MSNWIDLSYETATPGWSDYIKALGYEGAVQCSLAWPGRPYGMLNANGNLKTLRKSGLLTATYMAFGAGAGVEEQFRLAREAAGDEWEHCLWHAVDIEVYLPDPIASIQKILELVTQSPGYPIVYASAATWARYADGTDAFGHIPLWGAYWDGDPDFDYTLNPFGGFQRVVGEQFDHDISVMDKKIDVNKFDAQFIKERLEAQDMSMTNEEFVRMLKDNWQTTNEIIEAFLRNAVGDLRTRLTDLEETNRKLREALSKEPEIK